MRRDMGFIIVFGAAALLTGACDRPPSDASSPLATEEDMASVGLRPEARRRADQLISTFENSTTEIDYAYTENLDDGRGVTSGRAGFTTATCDALAVIELYTERVPQNDLSGFVPELERLCDEASDDTSGLPEDAYMAAWRTAASDDRFRAAQDAIVDREYFEPAMEAADELGLRTALARAQLYDTAIQHGAGDDPDGLSALVDRTNQRVGPPEQAGEQKWLDAYFDVRIEDLENPSNIATADAWASAVDRVECMRRIAEAYGYDLDGPITFTVYGDEFTIE